MPSLPLLPSTSSSLPSPLATTSAVTGSQATKQIAWQAAVYLVVTLGSVYVIRAPTRSGSPLPHPLSSFSLPTAIVAIVVGTILLIWNDGVPTLTRQREKMEPARHDSTFHFPSGGSYYVIGWEGALFSDLPMSLFVRIYLLCPFDTTRPASNLVQRMLQYFVTTLFPAFQHLGRATVSSLGSATSAAAARPQPALDLPLFRRPSGFREPRLATPRPAMPRDTSSFRVQSNPFSGSEPSSLLPATPSPSLPAFPGSSAGSAPPS